MVTLGADSHKTTHTLVAVDETGRKLAQGAFAANADGHLSALRWASQWGERRWALEDCRNLTDGSSVTCWALAKLSSGSHPS
jgi:hypothetical protein